jgi:hypothetical protein
MISRPQSRFLFLAILCAPALLLELGCGGSSSGTGGGGGGGGGSGPPTITSVTISGPSFSKAGDCQNFIATVSGSGDFNKTVQWYVDGILGGSSANGLISASGDYCAPATPPTNNPVTIEAISNGNSAISGSLPTTVIEIQISPAQANLYVGGTQQFSATVAGTINNSVIWQVSGITGGNSTVGTVSSSGLYTAPQQVTDLSIGVEAVSAESSAIYAGANINVSGLIVISPSNPQITYDNSQQFSAQVIGTSNTQVNWRVMYGSISATGLYTATASQSPDTVTAWNDNENGSTTVQIVGMTPSITSLSPQPATAGDTLTITGQNLGPILTAVFSDAVGGQIPAASTVVNSTTATVTVPQGSVTGNFFVQLAQGTLTPTQSNTVQFQRLARLRIRAPQNDVGAGESIEFNYALMGDATPQSVTFTADQGSFSATTYTAPSSVSSDAFAHITGCINGTQVCDTQILGLHPFRIAPSVPLVALGGNLQLSEVGTGGTGINWNLLAGGGTLQPDGLYTAGTSYQSGGPALVSANNSSATEQTSIGVTGEFPGLLNRIFDYVDQHTQTLLGTYTLGLAVSGTRMYVAATNHDGEWSDSYYWIDVYDITNPLYPRWVTSIESNSAGQVFVVGQYLYSYQSADSAVPGYPNTITIYSVQSGVPVLQARTEDVPLWWNIANNDQGILTLVQLNGPYNDIVEYDLSGGTIATTTLDLTLPGNANTYVPDTAYVVGDRMFVSVEQNNNSGSYILTYDLSTSPPNLLGTINARSLAFYNSGNLLFGALGGMEIYNISGQLPAQEGYIDGVNAQELVGTELLATTEQQGCQIVNVTNPEQPVVTSILFDGVITACNSGMFIGNYVYVQEGDGGVAIYDASETGGPIVEGYLYGGPYLDSAALDMLLSSNALYAATETYAGAVLDIYDATTNPPNLVGTYADETEEGGNAVQAAGNYVYFGMTDNLGVVNVSQPSAPTLAATLALPTISLAQANNTLYAGTSNNTLVVIDITNPGQPSIVSTLNLTDLPLRLRVSGNLLMVADNAAGLLIYNIANPQAPILLSSLASFTLAADVAVQGTTAYVAADVDGLGIVNISNPAQPVVISKTALSRIDPFYNWDSMNEALTIAINNGFVYIGTLNDNMLVFGLDCTNPTAPRIVSINAYAYAIEAFASTLLFSGTQMFVGGSPGGVYPIVQVNISQPLDSINQYFPPMALQNPAPLTPKARRALKSSRPRTHSAPRAVDRFHRVP